LAGRPNEGDGRAGEIKKVQGGEVQKPKKNANRPNAWSAFRPVCKIIGRRRDAKKEEGVLTEPIGVPSPTKRKKVSKPGGGFWSRAARGPKTQE